MTSTWSLDDLTQVERRFLADLLACDGSTMFIEPDEFRPNVVLGLSRLGLVEVDAPPSDVEAPIAVALTEDGETWVRSLPVGSLR